MSCSVRVKFLITVLCFFWVITSSEKMQAASNKDQDQIIIAEHSGAFGMMGDTLANITFPLLQTAALYGMEVMLEGKTHNFMGKSHSEMTATSAGLAAGNAFANTTVTALNHGVKAFTLAVEPIVGKDGWIIKLIPDGSLLAVPVMFAVYYSAHNKNYDFFAMDARGTIALYTGNAAMGLTYGQVEKAIDKGFRLLTGSESAVYGAAATSLVTGLAIGLLATRGKVDIAATDFNVFKVLSTALAVGHTIAYTGKAIRLGVKSMLVNQDVSEEAADVLGGVALNGVFTSTVVLLTVLNSKMPTGLKNYHGKIIGDITKNIGLIFSADLILPEIQLVRDTAYSSLDRLEDMLRMPDILKRVSHAARDPLLILGTHQLIVRALTFGKGGVDHIRAYDLVIGFSLGGFLGAFDRPYETIREFTWDDHALVWSLIAVTSFTRYFRGRMKTKVD